MKLHLSLIRTLPAHLRSGMLVAAHKAAAMMISCDAGRNPAGKQGAVSEDSFYSAALAGSGRL